VPKQEEVDRLIQELEAWENELEPLRQLWRELWARWTPQAPESSELASSTVRTAPQDDFLSKTRIPYEFHAVETILPRVVGQEPRMSYKAVDMNEDAPVAAILSGVTTWQMERMGFEYEIRNFARQALVTGYTVGKVGWVKEERDVVYLEQGEHFEPLLDSTFKVEHEVTEHVTTRNDPFFETVNVNDFVWPIWARNLDQAPALWQRRFVPKSYILELEEAGIYKDQVGGKSLSKEITGQDYGRMRDARRHQFESQGLSQQASEDYTRDEDKIVEIWERWTDTGLKVIISPKFDRLLVRDDANPLQHQKKPYIDWSPIPHPWQLHGLGIIQVLYDQNESLDTLRRQMHDALTFQIQPAFKTTEGLGQEQLSLFPGKLIEVDDLNDLEALVSPTVDWNGAWRMEQEIKSDMQRTSGAFEYLAGGTGDSSNQTATGVATITNEGNKRVAEMIKGLNERGLIRFGHLLAAMNAQFLESDVAVDFSRDPNAKAVWDAYAKVNNVKQTPDGKLVNVTADMVKTKGRLQPLPEIGADKQVNDIQRRSDATQVTTALAPFAANPQAAGLNLQQLCDYVLEQFGVQKADRDRIMSGQPPGASLPPEMLQMLEQNPDILQTIQQVMSQAPTENGSGPSGDNLPQGGAVGAPGVAGGSGPAGMSEQ